MSQLKPHYEALDLFQCCVEKLTPMAGDQPPGIAEGIRGRKPWAYLWNIEMARQVAILQMLMHEVDSFTVGGWPPTTTQALLRLSEIVRELWGEWGLPLEGSPKWTAKPLAIPADMGMALEWIDRTFRWSLVWAIRNGLAPGHEEHDRVRDRFCYTERMQGRKWSEIMASVREHPEWEELNSATALAKAANRHAKRWGLPPLNPKKTPTMRLPPEEPSSN